MRTLLAAALTLGIAMSALGYNGVSSGTTSTRSNEAALSHQTGGLSLSPLAPAWADNDNNGRGDGVVSLLDVANVAQYMYQHAALKPCQTWVSAPRTLYDSQGTAVIDGGYWYGTGAWAATVNAGGPADARACP